MNTLEIEAGLFRYAMWWRISYGTIRTGLGIFLFKIVNTPFTDVIYFLMNHELAGSRLDHLFLKIDSFLQVHPMSITNFLAIYLIFWGVIDIATSIALLRHKLWAFPVSLTLIAFFIVYELYRYTHTHSSILLIVILVDLAIFWLIKEEYINTIARRKLIELKETES